ncbi:hypothetical protein, partial [Escherichia coli]|uniref:hypothetical protein n=1 Tax=Escherichia coli TaxID=562 RepID=UPI00235F6959
PSAKGDDKFITTDYLQQCPANDPIFFLHTEKKPARRAGMKDNRTVSVEINDVTHFPGGYTNHPGQYRRYRNQRMRAVQCSFC